MNEKPPPAGRSRRRFLKAAAALAAAATGVAALAGAKPVLVNPCRDPAPGALWESPWLARVWQGLDPAQVWDDHVHLAGIGDSGKGPMVGSRLTSLWHPVLYGQRLAYLNAGCVADPPGTVDDNYARRLDALVRGMPAGVKALLFAFDWYHDDQGQPVRDMSTF
ncbi:MAG: hypothetical protein LBT54_05095, partial [Bifidobacteriaceae bacterium]|nr:hypothetical protein [Bifidobacteriaceae bacterium]